MEVKKINFNVRVGSVPITTTTSASPNSFETSNSQRETTHFGRLPNVQPTWNSMGQVSFVEDLLAENSVHLEWETRLNQNYVDNQPSLHTEDDQDLSELLLSEINIDNLPLTLRYMGNVDDLDLLPATTIAPTIISTLRDSITETAESETESAGKAKAAPLIKAHETAVQKKTRPKKKCCVKSCNGERKNVCSMMTIGNEICGKSFASPSALKDHQRSHTEEKPYVCKICDKKFKQQRSLVYHEKIHTGKKVQRKHVCCMMTIHNEICGKSFVCSSVLKNHQRSHAEEKPYVCKICDKTFKWQGNLVDHEKIHAEKKAQRKHVCCMMTIQNEMCGKSFVSPSALKNHQRSHAEEKPYVCKICDKTFKWQGNLVNHERIHTGKKVQRNHVCCMMTIHNEICGKSFDSLSALKRHEIIHTKENLYVCNICKKSYTQLSSILRHRKSVHQIESEVLIQT